MTNIDCSDLEKMLNTLKEETLSALGIRGVAALADKLVAISDQWKENLVDEGTKELNSKIHNAFREFFNSTNANDVFLELRDDEDTYEEIFTIKDAKFNGTTVTLIYTDCDQHLYHR